MNQTKWTQYATEGVNSGFNAAGKLRGFLTTKMEDNGHSFVSIVVTSASKDNGGYSASSRVIVAEVEGPDGWFYYAFLTQ